MSAERRLRVLVVTHVVRENDGQGRVNYEIARALLAAGHQVTLLASMVAPELLAHPALRHVEIPVSRVPSRLLQYQLFALRTGAWIRAHREEYDVVHVNGFISWARADVNAVHFVHDGWYRCGFYPYRFFDGWYGAYQVIYTRVNAWCERWAFRRSRVIVPVSHKVGEEVRALGLDASALRVIHNGVDTDQFAPGPSERERFGLPRDVFMLLFAGDLRLSRKNLDAVLRALALTPPHVHVAVAGGLRNSTYPALARELGVADRVHFLDFVTDMPALMRSTDAFVFPSRYEAMSLVLLEALSVGLPVITVATAGGSEVIDSRCGVVLDSPEDTPGLARAIERVAGNAQYAREMGQAARELARTLTWPTMAERYLSLYEELARGNDAVRLELAGEVLPGRS
ncbi:glycosyltransferase involved in cell wall biosynthesis [Paraburkholderia unamae]|uniref:Glycosyltransferase involved in cell wall biosynthesis n=1 Tax=Paraburkholderia unamae TaxID=219649 RepID=A0ABX5KKI0_9BURK|nr:glycosyltransferase family 4 protein [Paraburkholderia unamae]PVX82262.1 glycosyltransferase involved in cell wall biosynthesis [Paraburkholderia unamae]